MKPEASLHTHRASQPAMKATDEWQIRGGAWTVSRSAIPALLVVLVAMLSLLGRLPGEIYDSDAARHTMNGALLFDVVRQGGIFHPVEFAKEYYTHFPAISLPYHPPLFPLFEAALFSIFGVKIIVARAAVMLAAILSALLLYWLVLALNGSRILAVLTVVTLYCLASSRDLMSDVMLEFPTLALILAAIYCLREFDRKFSLGNGVWFAVFAVAGVWTKQTAIFLGFLPWVLVALTRRWSYLREKALWVSSAIFGFGSLLLLLLPLVLLRWSGANAGWHGTGLQLVEHHAKFYFEAFRSAFHTPGMVVLAVGLVVSLWRIYWRNEGWTADCLYLAWLISSILPPLCMAPYHPRYVWHAYPAIIVISYLGIFRLTQAAIGTRWAWIPAAAAGVAFCAVELQSRMPQIHGFPELAAFVAGTRTERVLYVGDQVGRFAAELRMKDAPVKAFIIRGDQLPQENQNTQGIDAFAREYGIERMVVVKAMETQYLATLLPTSKMQLEQKFPIAGSSPQSLGEAAVYRFTDPSPNPPRSLSLRSRTLGRVLELDMQGR